jgi:hypothetical protein
VRRGAIGCFALLFVPLLGQQRFFVRPGSPLFRAHRAVVLGDSSGAFGHNRALADVPTTLGSATALRAVAFMTLRKGKTLSCRI